MELFGISFALVFIIVYLLLLGLLSIIGLVQYILNSLGIFNIARRSGVKLPWLAWIPGVSLWTFGAIVDKHGEKNGLKQHWRITLPVTYVALTVSFVGFYLFYFLFGFAMGLMIDLPYDAMTVFMIIFVMLFYLAAIVMSMIAMLYSCCHMVCLYKIYDYIAPNKAIVYFLISMLVIFGTEVCLLLCGKKLASPDADQPALSDEA